VVSLNSYTRWGLSEIVEMSVDDLITWHQTASEMYGRK